MFLGIEIGGTKLQLGVGPGDGTLAGRWRGGVDVAAGAAGIRRQIVAAVPELLATAGLDRARLRAVGIGFGGPVDDATRGVLKSHQVGGWDGFPLAAWAEEALGLPCAPGNDADVAGLAEALFGAGKGLSPVFYMTIGSGIGGGLIIDGDIYRGTGRGAAEVGHLQIMSRAGSTLEDAASGWGIERAARARGWEPATVPAIARASEQGDPVACGIIADAWTGLADALCHVIALLCPRRIVIGGGVSLLGEGVLFNPLRRIVARNVFKPFADCYEIVPAALGEEVVVHGALALARRRFGAEGGDRMSTAAVEKKLMTAEEFCDFVHRPENDNKWFELVRGEVIELPPPQKRHGVVTNNLGRLIGNYTFDRGKGYVTGNDAGVILGRKPDTVRGPDIAVYEDADSWDELHPKYGEVPPRLAVEVVSPNDKPGKLAEKVADYLASGVELVWVVDPEERHVIVHRRGRELLILRDGDAVTGEDVLPGLAINVGDCFRVPAAPPTPPEA